MKKSMIKKCFKPMLACGVLLSAGLTVADEHSSRLQQCRQSLETSDKAVTALPACLAVLDKAKSGNETAYFELGQLLIAKKQGGDKSARLKKGLFYLVMAADGNHREAIATLANYVKAKMVDGKIPLKFSHYVDYLQKDWELQGKDPKHHYNAYTTWLDAVEQSQLEPGLLDGKTLAAMATDYENGYFLGANPGLATKLYQMAADKGDATGLYKTGKFLYGMDKTRALEYLHKAANKSSSDAMLELGDHYGCLGDKEQALRWYDKAIKAGNEYAEDEKTSLLETGKPGQCR